MVPVPGPAVWVMCDDKMIIINLQYFASAHRTKRKHWNRANRALRHHQSAVFTVTPLPVRIAESDLDFRCFTLYIYLVLVFWLCWWRAEEPCEHVWFKLPLAYRKWHYTWCRVPFSHLYFIAIDTSANNVFFISQTILYFHFLVIQLFFFISFPL